MCYSYLTHWQGSLISIILQTFAAAIGNIELTTTTSYSDSNSNSNSSRSSNSDNNININSNSIEIKKFDFNLLSPPLTYPKMNFLCCIPLVYRKSVKWMLFYMTLSSIMTVIFGSNLCSEIISQVSSFCVHHQEALSDIPLSSWKKMVLSIHFHMLFQRAQNVMKEKPQSA